MTKINDFKIPAQQRAAFRPDIDGLPVSERQAAIAVPIDMFRAIMAEIALLQPEADESELRRIEGWTIRRDRQQDVTFKLVAPTDSCWCGRSQIRMPMSKPCR